MYVAVHDGEISQSTRVHRPGIGTLALIVAGGLLAVALLAVALLVTRDPAPVADPAPAAGGTEVVSEAVPPGAAVATFAGGCFWCTEAAFQETPGVSNAISGYAGGTEPNPSYEDVYTGGTSHRESLQVYFDPEQVSYRELLEVYWRSIDPTDPGGQFVDRGMPYTTAIFVRGPEQRRAAQRSKDRLAESGRFEAPIVTEILPFTSFYQAEDYHQDFYQKSSDRYRAYEDASGREAFKALVWQEIQREEG